MKGKGGKIQNCLVGLVGVTLLAAGTLFGQIVNGTFTGSIADQSGAVIPGATVTATNEATNVAATATSNSAGLYTIADLLPGFYTVKVEAQGFKSFVDTHVELTTGYTQRVDAKLQVGAVSQEVTVSGQAPAVDTESDRMTDLVTAKQVENIPLNGRNIFQLVQLAPGAVNTTGLISEPGNRGFTTVVNGARVNMNGYVLDGISDKGLSGGSDTQPSVDSVQEVRIDTENISAEYGSVVGAVTSLETKSGSNQFHGDVYEFLRNDKLDARSFFEGDRTEFRLNQFGGTIGGPIKKDKLFFFASYEGERTRIGNPAQVLVESPDFRNLVESSAPNSVAALLFKDFPAAAGGGGQACAGASINTGCFIPLNTYITAVSGQCTTFNAACLEGSPYNIPAGSPLETALLANPNLPTQELVNASALQESGNQFYDGNQVSGRIDYQGDRDKIFGNYFYDHFVDPLYTPFANGGSASAFVALRGFKNPFTSDYPHVSLGWSRSIGPTWLNEFRAGWSRNATGYTVSDAGVPDIATDTGEVQFGGYNGYPQFFNEEVFQFSDLVSATKGRHNLKFGATIQRNYENSEFNVGRPSYAFTDLVSLSSGQVESESAGVDPGTIDPTTGNSTGSAHLASNIRGWRNIEFGAFINDNFKMTPRLTLTLGLRYDLYTRHIDKYGHTTEFNLPSTGANLTERLGNVNCYVDISGAVGFNGQPCDGGFAKNPGSLTTGDHNNFGPRLGFAWDVRGDGKTSLRGGFGVSYNGEIYNPLSNSRWNPPFYSFNSSACGNGTNVFGAGINSCIFGPVDGSAPTFSGPPNNIGQGPAGATANAFGGNIEGWNPFNSNAAILTGIVFPNFRDPYVYSGQMSLEHEFQGGFVLKTSWIGTFGHKLYRAEDINRRFDGRDSIGSGPFPNGACTESRGPYRVNCLYGRLRVWENSVNSNYNALQVVLDKKLNRGVELHTSYVWSHSLDTRSTWHSGATTANGAAEGFSLDQANPGLDYGNSIFDVRHRFTTSFVWSLPWYNNQEGLTGHVLGGWQLNGAIQIHSGFPWTPYCSGSSSPKGCDFNRDGVSNDRPNAPSFGNTNPNGNNNGIFESGSPQFNWNAGSFYCGAANPQPGCTPVTTAGNAFEGNLGRNTFLGPKFREVDLSLFKNIKATERINVQFRAEAFNIFNHTNLQQPSQVLNSNSTFGQSSLTYFPRQIQFALKLFF